MINGERTGNCEPPKNPTLRGVSVKRPPVMSSWNELGAAVHVACAVTVFVTRSVDAAVSVCVSVVTEVTEAVVK
jgi:hypothetical protein